MQLEVLAELQPPVVVRQREAAVDVVGHLFAGGVGEVIQRQDHHVVADADAAILTPEAEEFLRAHLTTSWSSRFGYGRGCPWRSRSEEHTSELQSLMRISYAVFCLKKKKIYPHSNTMYRHSLYSSN